MMVYVAHATVVFFVLSTLFYLLSFLAKKRTLWNVAQFFLLLGLLVQALGFGLHWFQNGLPLLKSAEEAFALSAWVLAFLFLLIYLKYRFRWLGLLFMPAVLILYSLSHFSNAAYADQPLLYHSTWASVHIVFSFLSFSLFFLTFLMGILFLLQEYQLKHKKNIAWLEKMPSLQEADLLHFKALRLGFTFLTLGILSGSAWAKSVKDVYFFDDPKQLWTLFAWLFYLFCFQIRYRPAWRGKRSVLLSLIAFFIILFTFLEVRHS